MAKIDKRGMRGFNPAGSCRTATWECDREELTVAGNNYEATTLDRAQALALAAFIQEWYGEAAKP